jgi:hypothetical protein
MQVSGERAKSANARHECFVMDAGVSVKAAETAGLDETQSSALTLNPRLLCAEQRACPAPQDTCATLASMT